MNTLVTNRGTAGQRNTNSQLGLIMSEKDVTVAKASEFGDGEMKQVS